MRCRRWLASLLERFKYRFRDFSSALLPAERRGRSFFGRFCFTKAKPDASLQFAPNSKGDKLVRSAQGVGWVNSGAKPGRVGPLLFDNCIGRKRDVGGVVLAGLWVLGWVLGR